MVKKRIQTTLEVNSELEELLEKAKGTAISPADRRLQAISFAYGNLAIGRPETLYENVVRAYDSIHPSGDRY